MANEATLIYETELPIPFTVSNTTGIEKGTVCKLSDPMTAAASTAADETFAGIASEEKIASDGKTKLGLYMRGIFKMVVGAAGSTVGFDQAIAGANTVVDADTLDDEEGLVVGKALETGTSGETILVAVGYK
jgi:hypothetical protein